MNCEKRYIHDIKNLSGGNQLRQGDGAELTYELIGKRQIFGKDARIRLYRQNTVVFETNVVVDDKNQIKFTVDEALPTGRYGLEVTIDDYKYPSHAQETLNFIQSTDTYPLEEIKTKRYQEIVDELVKSIQSEIDTGDKHTPSDITDYQAPDLSGYALKGHDHKAEDIIDLEDVIVGHIADIKTDDLSEENKAILDSKADKVHKHDIQDVTGLEEQLDSKSDKGHTHNIDEINGYKPTDISHLATKEAVEGKADKQHTHNIEDINGYAEPDLSNYATVASLEKLADLVGKAINGKKTIRTDVAWAESVRWASKEVQCDEDVGNYTFTVKLGQKYLVDFSKTMEFEAYSDKYVLNMGFHFDDVYGVKVNYDDIEDTILFVDEAGFAEVDEFKTLVIKEIFDDIRLSELLPDEPLEFTGFTTDKPKDHLFPKAIGYRQTDGEVSQNPHDYNWTVLR